MSDQLPPPAAGATGAPRAVDPPSGGGDGIELFISYARPDAAVAATLNDDLRQVSSQVWFDRELRGGQQWWDVILDRIRSADVFLFLLSPASLQSGACRSELAYAVALGAPIIPVMVRDTDVQLAPDPIGTTQYVDLRQRTPESVTALAVAVLQKGKAERVRPSGPPPEPPPPPIVDLAPLKDRLASTDTLTLDEQEELVALLRQHVASADQHPTLLALAEQLLGRRELAVAVKRDVDRLIATLPIARERRAARQRRSLAELEPDTVDLLRSLMTHVDNDHFTPIIGRGITDSLVGPMDDLAKRWAQSFNLPTKLRRRNDLPLAAQFVEVMNNVDTLRSALTDGLREQIVENFGESVEDGSAEEFNQVLSAVWRDRLATVDHDPHQVLAGLPCRIYVIAHPWALMADALVEAGKQPAVELCRWRPDVYEEDWPPSVFDTEPGYVPSVERPLVYHVFGTVDTPDSLVLSSDDYLDFLISVTQDPSLIPKPVRRVLADSALLLLGFGLDGVDVGVLLRALISAEGGHKLNKYSHVGAQADFRPGAEGRSREQKYLERYFGKYRNPSIDIFWGSIDEFAAGLAELRAAVR